MSGRTAIVTGATGALGAAVVARLLADGDRVAVPVRDPDRAPAGTFARAVDLLDEGAVTDFAEAATAELGAPSVLVCCAGGYAGGAVADTPADTLERMLALNVRTAWTATRAALPGLRAAGDGAIVYVGSRVVARPFAGGAPAIVSKAALFALCRQVALEERPHGVRANIVVPGVIDTPANRANEPDADHERWVPPARIAGTIAWLLSDAAVDTSGSEISVAGRS